MYDLTFGGLFVAGASGFLALALAGVAGDDLALLPPESSEGKEFPAAFRLLESNCSI
jgi:hypothetical protein